MAYADQLADFLDGVYKIDFELPGGLVINYAGFHGVAGALRARTIKVLSDTLEDGTKFAYNSIDNAIYYPTDARPQLTDIWSCASMVHEAAHAINDLYKRGSISKIDNEASGWIAQFAWLMQSNALQAENGQAAYSYLCGTPIFDRVYKAAAALGLEVYEHDTCTVFTAADLNELRTALAADAKLYKSVVGQKSTNNLGLPIRGKIKELDFGAFKLKLTVAGKDNDYKLTAKTEYVDSKWNIISKTDARFAVDKECIVVCEDAANPTNVTCLEAV